MPFDRFPQPILDPSVRDLEPRQRLERLRDWLYAGGPGEEAWAYNDWMNDCGTVGCAGGWYSVLTEAHANRWEFGISENQRLSIFYYAAHFVGGSFRNVTPQDVAFVIDKVLRGEIA